VYTQSAYAVLIVVGCAVGARWGIEGVAWGVLSAAVVLYAMKAFTIRAATGLPIRRYLSAVLPSVAAGTIMFVLVSMYVSWATGPNAHPSLAHLWIRLATAVVVGMVLYPCALAIIGRAHFAMVIEQVRLLLQRQPTAAQNAVDPTRA